MTPTTPTPAFCGYVVPVFDSDEDCPEAAAHSQAQRMEHHINEALRAALYVDEFQTVYGPVPGTLGEDPFDVLRQAMAAAEKLAVKGY